MELKYRCASATILTHTGDPQKVNSLLEMKLKLHQSGKDSVSMMTSFSPWVQATHAYGHYLKSSSKEE